MIKEFSFRFDELIVDRQGIVETLGFDGEVPEPFFSYLDDALEFSSKLNDIKAAYRIVDIEKAIGGKSIVAGGVVFEIGRITFNEIKGSDEAAFFVCSAGKKINEKSRFLMHGDDPAHGYVYDVVGSYIVEAAGDKMQEQLKSDVGDSDKNITNRYSPGYCHWHVKDQPKLFSFFPENICGVRLTPSHLMHPVKSISGIIGIGKNVKYREYICDLCNSKACIYKRKRGVYG